MPWQEFEGSEAALRQDHGERHRTRLLERRPRDGRGRRHRQRRLRRPLRPDPHPLRDVPRRPDPEGLREGQPEAGTPRVNTIIVCLFCGILAATIPLGELANATSIGTLFAFGLVNIAVVILRYTRPEMNRTFKVMLFPVTPILGLAFCVYMMFSLGLDTWIAFLAWMALGFIIYFGYSVRKARLAG